MLEIRIVVEKRERQKETENQSWSSLVKRGERERNREHAKEEDF